MTYKVKNPVWIYFLKFGEKSSSIKRSRILILNLKGLLCVYVLYVKCTTWRCPVMYVNSCQCACVCVCVWASKGLCWATYGSTSWQWAQAEWLGRLPAQSAASCCFYTPFGVFFVMGCDRFPPFISQGKPMLTFPAPVFSGVRNFCRVYMSIPSWPSSIT